MNRKRLEPNKTGPTGATAAPVPPGVAFPVSPRNSEAQRRMISKQPASGSANHARHHVSRRTQS